VHVQLFGRSLRSTLRIVGVYDVVYRRKLLGALNLCVSAHERARTL